MSNPLLKRIKSWRLCKKVEFYDDPQAELAKQFTIHWEAAKPFVLLSSGQIRWRRAKNLFEFDSYGWVTTVGSHEKSGGKIIMESRKRGNAENFFRDLLNDILALEPPPHKSKNRRGPSVSTIEGNFSSAKIRRFPLQYS